MPFIVSCYQPEGRSPEEVLFENMDVAKDFFQTTAHWFPYVKSMILLREKVAAWEEYLPGSTSWNHFSTSRSGVV
jgi:hypothetical protein